MTTIDNEYYVSLELAELLKQLGFDWKCRRVYCNWGSFTNDGCIEDNEVGPYNWNSSGIAEQYSAPTLDVAQRWLRELKDILLYITPKKADNKYKWTFWYIDLRDLSDIEQRYSIQTFNTYEEAQEAGIKKVLKLILGKEDYDIKSDKYCKS